MKKAIGVHADLTLYSGDYYIWVVYPCTVSSRDQYIVDSYYGIGPNPKLSLSSLSAMLSISTSRIHQILTDVRFTMWLKGYTIYRRGNPEALLRREPKETEYITGE